MINERERSAGAAPGGAGRPERAGRAGGPGRADRPGRENGGSPEMEVKQKTSKPAAGDDSGSGPDGQGAAGIVAVLGELPPGAVVSESALARMFGRCAMSIKRAVTRGELPPPTRLLGGPVWTAGALIRHIEARLERASKEAERAARKFRELRP